MPLVSAFGRGNWLRKKATRWCPCGWLGDPRARCRCTPQEVRRYQGKLSGPLLDRFDLAVEVPAVDPADLASTVAGEPSSRVRERVQEARLVQRQRFGPSGPASNARMGRADLERHATLRDAPKKLLVSACGLLGLTARGFDRVRRVARTLADLEGCGEILEHHVAEAVQYRGWQHGLGR